MWLVVWSDPWRCSTRSSYVLWVRGLACQSYKPRDDLTREMLAAIDWVLIVRACTVVDQGCAIWKHREAW